MDVTTQATIEEKTLEQIDKLTRANDARGIELINLRKACTKAIASNESFSRAQFLRNEEIKKSFNDGNELIDKVLDLQNEWNATIGAMVPSRLWKFIADEGGVCQHLFEF